MKADINADYYYWCCSWCDSENRMLWEEIAEDGLYCGACHRPAQFEAA